MLLLHRLNMQKKKFYEFITGLNQKLITFQVGFDDEIHQLFDEKQIDDMFQLERLIMFENKDASFSFQTLLDILWEIMIYDEITFLLI